MPSSFHTLQEFLAYLESQGQLKRIALEVDPYLEMTEISQRSLRENGPALFFEKVKGSPYPAVMNILSSEKRIELALGVHPEELGEKLVTFFDRMMPPNLKTIFQFKSFAGRFLNLRPKFVREAASQEIHDFPNLQTLPVLHCWPDDGGKFITLPQVITKDPLTGKRNVGMYRMQVFNNSSTGIHWQIQKGGGFHFYQNEKLNKPLEMAVAIGTDPATLLATVAALPEGMDEIMFAGFLRNARTRMAHARTINMEIPAEAEFILEGIVMPRERKLEGPFGDHFGHYSTAAEFPVFHVTSITHRRNPVYPATVVGRPPMEDKFLGDATQQMLAPLAKLLHTELNSLWAYYEAGFHNLLVISVEQRYQKEAMKTALGLMGMQQLALTKVAIVVNEHTNPRDFTSVLKAIRENFDPKFDFLMIPKVPLDTLDFTSYTMNLGSKMIIDATPKRRDKSESYQTKKRQIKADEIKVGDRRISDAVILEDTMLVVKVIKDGRKVIEKLVRNRNLLGLKIVAAVSDDVNINSQTDLIWGIFTRFDAARDVVFTNSKLVGIDPVHEGILGIDATWKKGYPKPLTMLPEIVRRVDDRWNELMGEGKQ